MKTIGKLTGIIIAVLLGVLLFKQQKLIERCARSEAATSQSFSTLAGVIRATEERLARESASQNASLSASLAELRPSQPAGTDSPAESRLAMKITCNTGEQIELTNVHLISNGKSSDALNLRADSLAFWLQVPWAKISKVTVRKSGTDTRPMGVVTLHDGTTHEHLIHSSDIRGQTSLGQMQIAIPDVREMVNVTYP
jgi:hypothetical protein